MRKLRVGDKLHSRTLGLVYVTGIDYVNKRFSVENSVGKEFNRVLRTSDIDMNGLDIPSPFMHLLRSLVEILWVFAKLVVPMILIMFLARYSLSFIPVVFLAYVAMIYLIARKVGNKEDYSVPVKDTKKIEGVTTEVDYELDNVLKQLKDEVAKDEESKYCDRNWEYYLKTTPYMPFVEDRAIESLKDR